MKEIEASTKKFGKKYQDEQFQKKIEKLALGNQNKNTQHLLEQDFDQRINQLTTIKSPTHTKTRGGFIPPRSLIIQLGSGYLISISSNSNHTVQRVKFSCKVTLKQKHY